MANKKVTLMRYAKTEQGWKRGNIIVGKDGRVKIGRKPWPTIYSDQEIHTMLDGAGRAYNRMVILTALHTGFRDQELEFLK
jgi:hypothetical protein